MCSYMQMDLWYFPKAIIYHDFGFHLRWLKDYQGIIALNLLIDYEISLTSSISLGSELFNKKL